MHKKIEVYTNMDKFCMMDVAHNTHARCLYEHLYAWILHHYAKPGDTILDTHLGSGSIACACYDAGYDLDAWEIDPEYYAPPPTNIAAKPNYFNNNNNRGNKMDVVTIKVKPTENNRFAVYIYVAGFRKHI